MEKANILSVMYQQSDSIEVQGKRNHIERYIKDGYYIKEGRNGYWVLVKAAKLNVTLRNSYFTRTFNMKADICNHYRKQRISKSLIERFTQDIKNEEISIYMDLEGNYLLR